MTEIAIMQETLEEKAEIAAILAADGLTKDLVDELIERIEVYGEDRIEIRWKFCDNILLQNMDGRVLRVTSF